MIRSAHNSFANSTIKMPQPPCIAAIARPSPFATSLVRRFSAFSPHLAQRSGANTSKEKAAKEKAKKRRKKYTMYKQHDLREIEQFTLCDAMRSVVLSLSDPSNALKAHLDTFELSRWEDHQKAPNMNAISNYGLRRTVPSFGTSYGFLTQ